MNKNEDIDNFVDVITGQESIKTEVTHKVSVPWETVGTIIAISLGIAIAKKIAYAMFKK